MATLLYTHADFVDHDTGRGHPERPQRLAAVAEALADPRFAGLERREAPEAETESLARAHSEAYVEQILAAIPSEGLRHLDPDTVVSPGTRSAALRAAGAVCAAVDAVMAGEADNAFCAVRPPGHHAEPDRPMGFCLFNNVVVGALHAREKHGLHRVAVVDFDVHHGNGTQAAFWDDPDLFYASTHQWPLFPGTGSARERGVSTNIVNVPLTAGSGSAEFRAAMRDRVLPALINFEPQFLIVSAGFDAHWRDPLASLEFQPQDFEWATGELLAIAQHACGGRVVSGLEGGYDLQGLAEGVSSHVGALMGL